MKPGHIFLALITLTLNAGGGVAVWADEASTPPPPHAARTEVPEPEGYKTDDYRSPVPASLQGARVIDAEEAEKLLAAKSAVMIDVYPRAPKPANLPPNTVWRDPTHMTIEGALWLPNVGYGLLSDATEASFKARLVEFTGGDASKPIVFFCLKNCWMSWNAAKRALSYGYTHVLWFAEGTDAWQEAGNELVRAEPVK